MRTGDMLALVGPIFTRANSRCRRAAGTSRGCQPLKVLASRNSRSTPSSSSDWIRDFRARTASWAAATGSLIGDLLSLASHSRRTRLLSGRERVCLLSGGSYDAAAGSDTDVPTAGAPRPGDRKSVV